MVAKNKGGWRICGKRRDGGQVRKKNRAKNKSTPAKWRPPTFGPIFCSSLFSSFRVLCNLLDLPHVRRPPICPSTVSKWLNSGPLPIFIHSFCFLPSDWTRSNLIYHHDSMLNDFRLVFLPTIMRHKPCKYVVSLHEYAQRAFNPPSFLRLCSSQTLHPDPGMGVCGGRPPVSRIA